MSADYGRWFRATPDSSVLARPRLLARTLIAAADLDERIDYYERLQGRPADLRMPIPDFGGLELAAVGGLLIIASERPFTPIQRQTAYSLIVPSLTSALRRLAELGGSVLEPPEPIVPGARARVRYPDGSVAELVEHRPRSGERPRAAANGGAEPWQRPGAPRLLARREVPRGGLAAALGFYTGILGAAAQRIRPGRAAGTELAVIGNLLLVAPATDRRGSAGPAFALLPGAPGWTDPDLTRAGRPAQLAARLVTLSDGHAAEAWGTPEQLDVLPETVR